MPQYPVPGGNGTSQPHDYYSNPEKYGEYQFVNLREVINNFMAAYVGEGKILSKALRADVSYHAHRGFQELHYDTISSCKSQEITLPASLTMRLPHDYVNYTKIAWVDNNGIERIIYPVSKTSKGNTIQQNADGDYLFTKNNNDLKLLENNSVLSQALSITSPTFLPLSSTFLVEFSVQEGYGIVGGVVSPAPASESVFKVGMEIQSEVHPAGTTITAVTRAVNTDGSFTEKLLLSNPSINFPASFNTADNRRFTIIDNTSSTTWGKYKSAGGTSVAVDSSSTMSAATDNDQYFSNFGQRYGLDPQYAQTNGSFYIDHKKGLIHFSSNLSGRLIVLHYLSDGIGTADEAIIHKFAEEAMYKWIAYGCASARVDVPAGIIQRLKQEKFAETRKAKIRLSNVKIEEITQIMRGKSKILKH